MAILLASNWILLCDKAVRSIIKRSNPNPLKSGFVFG